MRKNGMAAMGIILALLAMYIPLRVNFQITGNLGDTLGYTFLGSLTSALGLSLMLAMIMASLAFARSWTFRGDGKKRRKERWKGR